VRTAIRIDEDLYREVKAKAARSGRTTDPVQFPALGLDPTGLVARTLPLKPGQGSSMSNAAYDPAGALQLETTRSRPAEPSPTPASTSCRSVRPPPAKRKTLPAQRAGHKRSPTTLPRAAAVPGLPQSRCPRIDDSGGLVPRNWCIATIDRFAFKAVARQLDKAHQQMAAQYRILAG
jgi:hypothetical protein